ncbi:MAG: RluA family pseudouridine synthase, partial [Clostridia bacterium]
KTCKRIYVALLEGVVKEDSGIVDKAIARSKVDRKKMAIDSSGRSAVTLYKVLRRYRNYTLCEFELKTGRTHQIRVHAKFLGHPVVGDKTYGFKNQKFNLVGQLLHAKRIEFVHPYTQQLMTFECDIPEYFQKVLNILD